MKVISLGLQCSVPEGIKKANFREYSYPFDWLWTPSNTTYEILHILLHNGIEKAVEYMTTGYTYYTYLFNEHYVSTDNSTECQMNKHTGLGITHFTINQEYKHKLKIRLERLWKDILSNERIVFLYADAANPSLNYHLDEVEYGLDATTDLIKIHELMYSFNKNTTIVYFCWKERKGEHPHIEYVPFDFKNNWMEVSEVVKDYLIRMKE